MATAEPITILIVPRDRFSVFPKCIEAIYAHTTSKFRVVVLAGGMDSATQEFLTGLQEEKDNFQVVSLKQLLTQIELRRMAMEYAQGRYCVLMENDTIVHENWLSPLMACMLEERAAVVMPLIYWYRGLHAAGCSFEEKVTDGETILDHNILYIDISRKQIGYPESHLILMDLDQIQQVELAELFDDVEPFDVDFGLTLRKHRLPVWLEPQSVVTYDAPPPWEVRDIPPFQLRWDEGLWTSGNERFTKKWGVSYDSERKQASYRMQQRRLGLARWWPNRLTIAITNLSNGLVNRALSIALGW
jgi:glycosyltransferase involved in cell wall biosynthesis